MLPGTRVVKRLKDEYTLHTWDLLCSSNIKFISTSYSNHTSARDSSALTPFVQVEWNQVRHLVEDISCLFKGLDLRLMLCTKRILKTPDVSSC